MIFTKEEFKNEWENNPNCVITFGDCADCAKAWGLLSMPRCAPVKYVRYKDYVLLAVQMQKNTIQIIGKMAQKILTF